MSGWGKELASIWTNNVAPSRPSNNEMCVYTRYLRGLQESIRRPLKLLVLGSTPEFRDWGYEEDLSIYVVDKSKEYYYQVSREIRHKNLHETVFFSSWEEMRFDEKFDIIIGDLSIGNIDRTRFDQFLENVANSLSQGGLFLGKSFLWLESEPIKTPKQIIDDYKKSIRIHPYTFINHQLGLFCLDKETRTIDFSRMYSELLSLHKSGYIDDNLFSYFNNVGWNTEMKFEFFAPSQEEFAACLGKVSKFVGYEHTMDIYTNVFPIYVATNK